MDLMSNMTYALELLQRSNVQGGYASVYINLRHKLELSTSNISYGPTWTSTWTKLQGLWLTPPVAWIKSPGSITGGKPVLDHIG